MRQQLISWLIEDIAPEIRRNGDPEGVILKFANEKNLEPALVQSLGQLYNTAKTLAYMEKSANRGGSFPLLDVEKVVDKYLDVHTKSASRQPTAHAADLMGLADWNQDWSRTGLPECFDSAHMGGLKVETETYDEQIQKRAAVRDMLRTDDEYRYTLEQLKQAKMEFTEDARELLTKMAAHIKQNGMDFENFERDALWLYGADIKPAADLLANYCADAHVKVARAADAGPKRLVDSGHVLFSQLDQVRDCLLKIAVVTPEIESMVDKAFSKTDSGGQKTRRSPDAMYGSPAAVPDQAGTDAQPGKAKGPAKDIHAGGPSAKEHSKNPKSPVSGAKGEAKSFTGNIKSMHGALKDFLGTGFNRDQQHVDNSVIDAKHLSVLQNLMTTDDVLAEADPEHVVSMYNTLRSAAPSIASDPNVVRVALRSMVQHDGISPFDVKGFLDTESAQQKTHYNKRLLDEMNYGGAGFKPTPSPKPMT